MKKTLLLGLTLMGIGAAATSARAETSFGFSFGFPFPPPLCLPAPPRVVIRPPVVIIGRPDYAPNYYYDRSPRSFYRHEDYRHRPQQWERRGDRDREANQHRDFHRQGR